MAEEFAAQPFAKANEGSPGLGPMGQSGRSHVQPFQDCEDPMKIDLSGKTAIVTGSTAGIGFAIAQGLAECGAGVVINGRSQATVDKALSALRNAVPAALVRSVVADVGTALGCQALLDAEPSADILVNNVGIYGPADFFEIPDGEWTRFFEVNGRGAAARPSGVCGCCRTDPRGSASARPRSPSAP